jgi:hypothetical protein
VKTDDKMQGLIFGLDVLCKTLKVFASKAEAVASVKGLEIAEGDWRFFSADGSPMKSHFSTPAQIFPESNTYTNGVYTLEPADTGPNLYTLLSVVSCEDHAQSGLHTLRDVEQFLIDHALGEV